jgi:hypothetical protein
MREPDVLTPAVGIYMRHNQRLARYAFFLLLCYSSTKRRCQEDYRLSKTDVHQVAHVAKVVSGCLNLVPLHIVTFNFTAYASGIHHRASTS